MKEAVVSGATTPPSSDTMEGEGQPKEQEAPQQQQEQQQPAAAEKGAAGGEEEGSPLVPQEGEEQPHAPGKPANGTEEGGDGGRRTGKCKWFNVLKGFGFITPHDGSQDIFVHQSVIQMTGFRSLGEGEEVEFECKPSDKGIEATFVSGPQSSDCKGSDRRPMGKKKYKKIRCYNCGDFGNHIAAKCPHGPLPKRCHFCKAENHLIADCPQREQSRSQRDSDSGADTPGLGSSNGGEGSGSPDEGGAGSGTEPAAEVTPSVAS